MTENITVSDSKKYIINTQNYDGNTRNICFWQDSTFLGYKQYSSVPYVFQPPSGATKMRSSVVKDADTFIGLESDGTVYSGTLDATTGILTIDRKIYAPTGDTTDFTQGSGNVYISNTTFKAKGFKKPIDLTKDISSHLKGLSASSTSTPSFSISAAGYFAVNGVSGVTDTVAHWKTYLASQITAGTPVQFLLRLETPTTHQLTAAQVQTLIGTNNIWTNTTDNLTVEYWTHT